VSGSGRRRSSRWFWILTISVGVFLVADLGAFGFWVFHSLSQRELDRVLSEARQEAHELAKRLEQSAARTGGDLFTAVALAQETQTYIDSVLRQRPIVRTVEITDSNGVLVMRQRRDDPEEPAVPAGPAGDGSSEEIPATVLSAEAIGSLDVSVAIGSYGNLRIGLSPTEMARRIAELRVDLIWQTTIVALLTGVLLAGALALMFFLVRRGERLEVQAAEAERLAYVGTLAAGLAHEIRNPLNSLNLNLQLLEEDLPEDGSAASGRRLVTVTRSEIARLERLVSEFLAYARPRPIRAERQAAIDLLAGAREVLQSQIASREAIVRLVDDSSRAAVLVDDEQIRQLLLNLLQNAIASVDGTGRKPAILLLARREGERVELIVEDNGSGVAPAERERIFDAFYSTRRGGIGLGLAIARRIAISHGGSLECESEFGEGSRFVLSLPRAGEAPAAERPAATGDTSG